jgi:hypothetical protein
MAKRNQKAIHVARFGTYIDGSGVARPRHDIAVFWVRSFGGLSLMRKKQLLWIGGGVVAFLVLALVAVNMLISADAVRDRRRAGQGQTGRRSTVNGSTSSCSCRSAYRAHRC